VLSGRDNELRIGAIFELSDKDLCRSIGCVFGIKKIAAHKNNVYIRFSDILHHLDKRATKHSAPLLALFGGNADVRYIEMNVTAVKKSDACFFAHPYSPFSKSILCYYKYNTRKIILQYFNKKNIKTS
jgi:hypothetical protein